MVQAALGALKTCIIMATSHASDKSSLVKTLLSAAVAVAMVAGVSAWVYLSQPAADIKSAKACAEVLLMQARRLEDGFSNAEAGVVPEAVTMDMDNLTGLYTVGRVSVPQRLHAAFDGPLATNGIWKKTVLAVPGLASPKPDVLLLAGNLTEDTCQAVEQMTGSRGETVSPSASAEDWLRGGAELSDAQGLRSRTAFCVRTSDQLRLLGYVVKAR